MIPVLDFRRHSMVLEWHPLGGAWTAADVPPALVHGIALIRPSQPNICVYGQNGELRLQIGPDQYALSEHSPVLKCTRGFASFGFRRRFTVESSAGDILCSHTYWTDQGPDFLRWLAEKSRDPAWRAASARQWSEGVAPAELRPR